VPTKLVVTDSDKGRVVSLESSRGNTLLTSAPMTDKRATAGTIRSLKAVLKDSVSVDDRTVAQPAKPSRPAPIAKGVKVLKAKTQRVPAAPARKARAAKALVATPQPAAAVKAAPKTRKRAAK
jgi:hypothetical protein